MIPSAWQFGNKIGLEWTWILNVADLIGLV